MENGLSTLVGRVFQQFLNFTHITMDHSQIQWAEILVEGHVGEVIINVEEESVGNVDRGFLIGDPVKFIWNYFDSGTIGLVSGLFERRMHGVVGS